MTILLRSVYKSEHDPTYVLFSFFCAQGLRDLARGRIDGVGKSDGTPGNGRNDVSTRNGAIFLAIFHNR